MFTVYFHKSYSAAQKKRYEHCCMKQKCQIQMGIAQYKIATTPLKTKRMRSKILKISYVCHY